MTSEDFKGIKNVALKLFTSILLLFYIFSCSPGSETLFEGDSIYHHITITQNNKERCMLFGRYRERRETCIDLKENDSSIFEYTEMMFVGFLFNHKTEKVVLFGLGGGFIPLVFRKHLPEVKLTVVEIDPLVHRLAKKYFDFQTSSTVNLIISDGRQYLKKIGNDQFDQIWIDVFNSDYIPSHMTTKEFLILAKSRLTGNGVIIQNVHSNNQLYDFQISTFQAVFKNVYILKGKRSTNAIIVASDNSTYENALQNNNSLENYKIGKINLNEQFFKINNIALISNEKILTDDFSPSNLLLHKK